MSGVWMTLKLGEARTSASDPLKIAELPVPGGGVVGLSFCPGKKQARAMTGSWNRDLDADLDAIRRWGAEHVITLVEPLELVELSVPTLGDSVARRGMSWWHLPIVDGAPPDAGWLDRWRHVEPVVLESLMAGGKVFVHCKGGLGRAGTVAAMLLLSSGSAVRGVVERVRSVRPGAIETAEQEQFLLNRGLPD